MNKLRKGFTLIELLVVIAVMAVVASAVLVLINPVDKINSANDSKVQADLGQVATAATAYAASHSGFYAPDMATMQSQGELSAVPSAPTGYSAYSYAAAPGGCTTACTSVVISGQLKSIKYTGYTSFRYDSATGIACAWSGSACRP